MQSNYGSDFRAPKVDIHQFSMIPRADIPRSVFMMQHQHKTTIQASCLTPIYLQEVLPGDMFNMQLSAFCRLATPIYPLMDNAYLETWFFFVPNRLVWMNWERFQGSQDNPSDSISYVIPQVVSPVGGFSHLTNYDYFGLPCTSQTLAGNTISVSALPFRALNLIYNEWFRDQNLDGSVGYGSANSSNQQTAMDNGPDPYTNYNSLLRVRKVHDYFTSCLPWTQKGGVAVTIPLGTQAIVKTSASGLVSGTQTGLSWVNADGTSPAGGKIIASNGTQIGESVTAGTAVAKTMYPGNLYADLSTASAATVNALRLAFQTQKLLERDARGGTRYTEMIRSHFGVMSPDMRLQRPEYLGGGKTPVNVIPVPQTSGTAASGTTTPLGQLSAAGLGTQRSSFRQSFTEHGHIIGLATVRSDPIYQQGIRRLWSRSTRYDFYLPVFAMLGEQAVLNKEIYSDGSANDALTFGYQERWAEYRYHPSFTTGFFNSTNATPLDSWHLAQKFTSLPALNSTFIQDQTEAVVRRAVAAGSAADGQQLLCDFFFAEKVARPMPTYSVPGLIDHF